MNQLSLLLYRSETGTDIDVWVRNFSSLNIRIRISDPYERVRNPDPWVLVVPRPRGCIQTLLAIDTILNPDLDS
jgi:hypothetical protein